MNLDVLKSKIHFKRWRDGNGSVTLSFDVVPKDNEKLEIGDKYILCSSGSARFNKGRTPVKAYVSISDDAEIMETLQVLDTVKKGPICGMATFHPEKELSFEYAPAGLFFNIVVPSHIFEEIIRTIQHSPSAATFSIGLEGLEYGPAPDGSHTIWSSIDSDRDTRPISYFSYDVERFWTSETAIYEENRKKEIAELWDSPDPEARDIAARSTAEELPDPIAVLLKQCRLLLAAIFAVGIVALLSSGR